MNITAQRSFIAIVAVLVGSTLIAEDKAEKRKQNSNKRTRSVAQIPSEIVLEAPQTEAIKAMDAEYGPKLQELRAKQGEVLTAEQKQKMADVRKAAKGKDKAEAAKEIRGAIQLTDEQKTRQTELKKEFGKLNAEIQEKVAKILTKEQQEKIKQIRAERKAKKRPAESAPAAKPAAEKPADK